jgi:hypothetical protein
LIFSDTAEEHARKLGEVFFRFRKCDLQLQPPKCVFAKDKVTYLGFEVSSRKDAVWDWNKECQDSFEKLKEKLYNTPVLAFPDFKEPFILTVDASSIGLGAVLSQVQEGIERPISFASRQLNNA